MSLFHTSTLLLFVTGFSAWYFLQGAALWAASCMIAAAYLLLFGLGVCILKLNYFSSGFHRGSKSGRTVTLTFDDGPDPAGTPELLRVLSRHGVKAAFFVIGRKAEGYPDLLRKIDEHGHVIGNHFYSHAWYTAFFTGRSIEKEITSTQKAIQRAVGKVPNFLRPPAGLTNPHFPGVLKRQRLHLIGWDVRPFDTHNGAGLVVERVIRKIRSGSVILLHEGTRSPDELAGMVESIIRRLLALGYTFTGLEEMVGLPAYQESNIDLHMDEEKVKKLPNPAPGYGPARRTGPTRCL
ncbi:MAG: polysaccharide deacetylase family protein [Thermodesulfobacteriota bacterium]